MAWNEGDQRFPIDPAPLTQVQESLKSDETLLEYVLDEPNSFCISVTRTTASLRVLPAGRKQIEKLVQRYIDEIRAKKAGAEEAKQLYAFLVQPIPETSTGKRFIVVPDGILNLLPFEALRNSHGQYLLTSDVISYAPSATVLDALRRRDKQQEVPSTVPRSGGRCLRKSRRRRETESRLPRHCGAGLFAVSPTSSECRFMICRRREKRSRASVELWERAQKLCLVRALLRVHSRKNRSISFGVLHLAVHGFADPLYPERSALVLGADPKAGEDGLLQVREIKKLRLNADLTTLSACDTGVGKLQGEEGISDLAEAFLAAGSKTVVASLWSADDTFASALMERFYQRLALGEETSSALRGAKLDLLTKYGEQVSPFYWAGFVAIGDASTPIRIREQ